MQAVSQLLAATLAGTVTGSGLTEYCPAAGDLGIDYGSDGKLHDQGWTINKAGRASTKAAYNLLGGSVEFDIDLKNAHTGVNQNFYTVSPTDLGGKAYETSKYCDGQEPKGRWCMELDLLESNGDCGGATTLHTANHAKQGCNRGGCQATFKYPGGSNLKFKAEWNDKGEMTINLNGKPFVDGGKMNPKPDKQATGLVVSTMKKSGVVFVSSQWKGWVPLASNCSSKNDLDSSSFSISNLVIRGSVVSGPKPKTCKHSSSSLELALNGTEAEITV